MRQTTCSIPSGVTPSVIACRSGLLWRLWSQPTPACTAKPPQSTRSGNAEFNEGAWSSAADGGSGARRLTVFKESAGWGGSVHIALTGYAPGGQPASSRDTSGIRHGAGIRHIVRLRPETQFDPAGA